MSLISTTNDNILIIKIDINMVLYWQIDILLMVCVDAKAVLL